MTDKDNNNSFPLWQKILYGFLALFFILLFFFILDKLGVVGVMASAGI